MTRPPRSRRAAAVRRIDGPDDIAAGVRWLTRACPHMRRAHALAGDPPLRREAGGFEGLARIIVGQQVSTASADAIWARFAATVRPMAAARYMQLATADHVQIGLSRPKIRALHAVAAAIAGGALDLDRLAEAPDDTVRDRLLALHGIGPWSADIYLMFCLGRVDAFAPGDLALQVAAERLMELAGRPDAKALAGIAERWRPWRGVAARLLWAYYRVSGNSRSGAPL